LDDDDTPGPQRLPQALRDQHARNRARMLAALDAPLTPHTMEELGRRGRDRLTAWYEYGLLLGADLVAADHFNAPDKFKGGVCSYRAYKFKARLHSDVAMKVVALLSNEVIAIEAQSLDRVTASAVQQLFYRQRDNLENLIQGRAADIQTNAGGQ
jgi:hypothetical protein